MTQAIAKYAARKMLNKEMDKYKSKPAGGDYDPFYENIPHPRKPGKTKKVKKQVPAYIPSHDAEILARARKTAYRLDYSLFNFLGFRFGWSSVIGLVPAIGDGADAALSVNLIRKMRKVEGGLPRSIVGMMLFNMILDFFVGLIPFIGDLADAALKCNSKNVRLLENYLDKIYKPRALAERDDLEAKRLNRRSLPATVYEDFSDEEDERKSAFDDHHDNVRAPHQVYSGRRGERLSDEEMGLPREDTHRSHRNDRPSRDNTRSSRR
ncbi:hypothetical protein P154DRAFT_51240 [Amniculicola lignicola CBS 123094]|uniref:PH domain-containing protein n=1 Tax=Amniculicola lignicola CBS 123094 TaxID=1392246 RepID=A0A6A5WR89_9PLEO|nr:hypothetical protein P154DRAFT_51240 [Amniculicola lignicola CBS 123094]